MEMKSILAWLIIGILIGAAVGYLLAPSLGSQQSQINTLQAQITNLHSEVSSLQTQVTDKDTQIANLTNTVNQLSTLALGISSASFATPPELQQEINNATDVINDLSSLGCKLMETGYVSSDQQVEVSYYSDFRWIAYNTKLVFYFDYGTSISCWTIYRGFDVLFNLPY
jgi:gas vesicle protein